MGDDTGSGVTRLSGVEKIDAGEGNDIIDLTSARYDLTGENIELQSGAGNDTIWGSSANEIIFGGDGDDILFGGSGTDTLIGGSGSDTFEFTLSANHDTITDFDPTSGDVIHIYGAGQIDEVDYFWEDSALFLSSENDTTTSDLSISIEFSAGISDPPDVQDILSNILIIN